jgi:hypothetical protein
MYMILTESGIEHKHRQAMGSHIGFEAVNIS